MTDTIVTNDVFTAAIVPAPTSVVTPDTLTGTVAELVGEGKKYKTIEALAASVVFKDEFIETLKREKQEVEAKFEKVNKADEVFKQLLESKEVPQAQTVPNLSSDEIAKLIEATISNTEVKRIETNNIKSANDSLVNHFGSLEKAQEFVNTKSKELGLSVEFLMTTAKKSPSAFMNVIGVSGTNKVVNNPITTGTVNTTANYNSGGIKEGTEAYFNEILKKDRKKYMSPEIQKQIMDAATKGTYFKQ